MELQDKVALVTGAASPIGRAIAAALGRAGANIALHYFRSADAAGEAAEQIRAAGRRAELFRADLADTEQIEAMFDAVAEAFGRLDVLINNAAVFDRTPIETLSREAWDTELAVNARAPALCIRYAAGLMRSAGGAIVNIADIAAERPWAAYPAYCASKAALVALTKSTARALAAENIRVNAVSPGMIMRPEDISADGENKILAQVPMRRPGRAEDVAEAVLFLLRSDYITAQNLRVDGGWHMG